MKLIHEIDKYGKNIVWKNESYFIAIDNIQHPSYVTLWYTGNKSDGEKVGELSTRNHPNNDGYIGISYTEIKPKHRGLGFSKLMYRILLQLLPSNIKGISSYLPDRANKKQIPKIYKSLGGFIDGDFAYIPKSINESYSDEMKKLFPKKEQKYDFTKYVWYNGKCWRYEGLKDHKGYVSLVSFKNSSEGINVDPNKIRNCTQEEIDALDNYYFKEHKINNFLQIIKENLEHKYHYIGCCVDLEDYDIIDMLEDDSNTEITYDQFMTYIDKNEIIELFPQYDWSSSPKSLTLKKDWSVKFYKSFYRDLPCVYMDHSAIEYVFIE